MRNTVLIIRVLIAALALATVAAGCGGSSSSSSSSSASTSSSTTASEETEWSEPFLSPKGTKKVPTFGEEADTTERQAASGVLEEFMVAREASEWEKQCGLITKEALEKIEENAGLQGVGGGCAKELKFQAEPLSETKSIRENTMTGPIDSLRVSGAHAFAIYDGTGGKTYAIPMQKVGDEWKVDHLITTELE